MDYPYSFNDAEENEDPMSPAALEFQQKLAIKHINYHRTLIFLRILLLLYLICFIGFKAGPMGQYLMLAFVNEALNLNRSIKKLELLHRIKNFENDELGYEVIGEMVERNHDNNMQSFLPIYEFNLGNHIDKRSTF